MQPEEIRRHKEAGWTHQEIADHYGVTVSGVQQVLQVIGYIRPQASHKEAIPWKLTKEHKNGKVANYLRHLSLLAQNKRIHKGDRIHLWKANTAINWAIKLIDAGLDIDYDRDSGPSEVSESGGFFTKPVSANKEDRHLEKLMQRVRVAQTCKI
jgi:hypothetical protein